jgi:hypothetical protein
MGGADDRQSRPTIPFDSQALARLAEQGGATGTVTSEDDEFGDEEPTGPAPRPARTAAGTSPPDLHARTSTMDDPLTTSVLAEVARRAHTIEVTPDEVAAAQALGVEADVDADAPDELIPPRRA